MAIKTLQENLFGDSEEIRARFQRETRLLDDVLDHPNIVPVLHRNVSGEDPYFVMPKADSSLEDEMADRCTDEEWVSGRFREILDAIAYAHGKGVIHRDIKPANALLFDGTIKISDFGLGKALEGGTTGVTKTSVWSGTEPYMAPEQFTDMRNVGPQADVFSLGKLLMALLTGETPSVGAPDVSELPERFRYFVSRCCEKEPGNRFADGRECIDAFERIVEDPNYARLVQPPTDRLAELVEIWFGASEIEEIEVLRSIDEHLRSNPDEEKMYTREVPRLPVDVLDQYLEEMPDAFVAMLAIYDEHVSGGLPWEYCDVVADFYVRIYRQTERLDLRKLILSRLLTMGYAHNRWHVQQQVMTLLREITDPSTVAMAADVLQEHGDATQWHAPLATESPLPEPIYDAFQAATSVNN